jgi:peptide/nickel transport system substrate-binding protein
VAFDEYFLGRPKIDRITVRFFGDVNALVVALMAGDIDLITVGSMKEGEGYVLKSQWESLGSGTVLVNEAKLRHGTFQFRDTTAPWVPDPRIRRALVHLIDRDVLVETVRQGLSSVDDITLPRSHPAYRLAQQRGLPRLNYDVTQAHRLFAEAGLARGADGAYRTQSGAPFAIELGVQTDFNTNIQEMLAISNAWKSAGLEPTDVLISGATPWQEVVGAMKGVYIGSSDLHYESFNQFISSQVSSEANRWRGSNRGGYVNPAFDQLRERVFSTVDATQRDEIAADAVKMIVEQVLYLPLIYNSDVSAVSKQLRGVTGVMRPQPVTAWNVHVWDKAQ